MKRQAKPAVRPKRGGTAVTFPWLPALPCQQHSRVPGQQGWKTTTPGLEGTKPGIAQECMSAAGKRGLSLAQHRWHTRGVTPIWSSPILPRGHVPQLQDLIPTAGMQLVGLLHMPPSLLGLPPALVLVCRWHSHVSFFLIQGAWPHGLNQLCDATILPQPPWSNRPV